MARVNLDFAKAVLLQAELLHRLDLLFEPTIYSFFDCSDRQHGLSARLRLSVHLQQ